MRIIGGRDYYDSALAYGHDTHTTFVRGRTEISEAAAQDLGITPSRLRGSLRALKPATTRWSPRRASSAASESNGKRYELSFPTVIACGVRYQGVRAEVSRVGYAVGGTTLFFWNATRFQEWLAAEELEVVRGRGDPEIGEFFVPTPLARGAHEAVVARRWTLLVHSPTFVGYGPGTPWKVDQDALKSVEFFRAVPPNEMYQEIDMWTGGVLPKPGPPMVELSDEDRIAKHGFDKGSFRTPKTAR